MNPSATPGNDIPILSSIELDRCWVCGKVFIECGGNDPAVIRNRHHIVPRACGGTDGPTVTLCSAHHDLLHAVATQALASKPFQPLMEGLQGMMSLKVSYLADVVCRSTRMVADDPNKRGQIGLTLSGTETAMLKRLAKDDKLSMAGVLIALLHKEYARRYPQITNYTST